MSVIFNLVRNLNIIIFYENKYFLVCLNKEKEECWKFLDYFRFSDFLEGFSISLYLWLWFMIEKRYRRKLIKEKVRGAKFGG